MFDCASIFDPFLFRQAQLLVPAGSVGGRAAMRGIPATRTGKEWDIYNAVLKESQCV
jgi:hypothetical protein